MVDFKAGDMVVVKHGHYTGCTPGSRYNLPRTPMKVATADCGYLVLDVGDGEESPAVNPGSFELAPQEGPIRTVTRREIVPGKYGGVVIDEHQTGDPLVRFNAKADSASLRSAAKLFNELADVLDERA